MSWTDARSRFAYRSRGNFVDQVSTAMGVEDEIAHLHDSDADAPFTSLTRDEYQEALDALGALDHIDLKYEDDSPWDDVPVAARVDDAFFEEHLTSINGFFPDEQFNGNGYEDVVAEISFDLSNEFEKATGVNVSLVTAHHEREMIDELQLDSIPDGSGLYRVAHVPGLMGLNEDFFSRDNLDADGLTWDDVQPYMTQKRRYFDHLKSHGLNVMSIGGTDSIQVTMRPLIDEDAPDEQTAAMDATYGEGYTRADQAVDDMFRDFHGGGDRTGIPALSALFYAPFMNSPVFDEDGDLASHMGRDCAYSHGFTESDWADDDKWGYVPELAHVEGMEDVLDVFAEKVSQFSAGVEADAEYVTVKGTDRSPYDVLKDDLADLDPEDAVNIRVGKDGGSTVDFTDIMENRRFEGIVSSSAGSEEEDAVVVEVDYSDMDDEEFYETMWGHFQAHASGVWPSYRPRFNAGAFESRDYGNSPRIREAVDTQAAVYLKWRELQQYADEELGMWEGYADIVRDGVTEDGLDYTLPSGHTVKEAWLGDADDLDRGLLDILAAGVREASYADADVPAEKRDEYVEEYRSVMEAYLDKGTYAEVFARQLQEDGFAAAMEQTQVQTEEPATVTLYGDD